MSQSYFYIIRHKPSGMRYAGARWSARAEPDDLWKTYFTSSKTVQRLIDIDGKDSFEIETIVTEFKGKTALEYETEFLQENLGEGWLNSHANRGFGEGRFGAGHKAFKESFKKKYGVENPNHLQEVRQKISDTCDARYGCHPNQREESRAVRSASMKAVYAAGLRSNPMLTASEESKARVGKASKARRDSDPIVRCPHCDKEGKGPPMMRWHFDRCKEKK